MYRFVLYLRPDRYSGSCTDGRKCLLEEAGGVEQHNITEAAPNELKRGEGR